MPTLIIDWPQVNLASRFLLEWCVVCDSVFQRSFLWCKSLLHLGALWTPEHVDRIRVLRHRARHYGPGGRTRATVEVIVFFSSNSTTSA